LAAVACLMLFVSGHWFSRLFGVSDLQVFCVGTNLLSVIDFQVWHGRCWVLPGIAERYRPCAV